MVIEACLQGAALLVLLPPAGGGADHGGARPRLLADKAAGRVAVQPRHAYAQQAPVRPQPPRRLDRLQAAPRGTELVSIELAEGGQALRGVRVVVRRQDAAP